MIWSSILLLLFSAAFHAVANACMKQARDKLAFVWWMLGVFSVLLSPVLLLLPDATTFSWALVILSGVLETVYFIALTRAYSLGDLSLVYPIARGSAPLFLLVWAAIFLEERPTVFGIGGILCIVAGLYLINLSKLSDWRRPLTAWSSAAARWALITGFLISTYTLIDKIGVRYFSPFIYLYLILFVCWLLMGVQWLFAERRRALVQEIGGGLNGGSMRRIMIVLLAAFLGAAGYLLVLTAMRISPVSYVAPVREVSVVIGAWIGVRFLQEQGGSLRISASLLVVTGIFLIALGG